MTISPEKNDIEILKLFSWGSKFAILDSAGNEKFAYYARLIGDADLNRARVFGLRKSAELRRTLKNLDSEERKAFIAEKDLLDVDKLIETIIYMSMREISLRSVEQVNVPFPKEPSSDATLEEQENYQLAVDDWPKFRDDKVRDYVTKEVQKLRDSLLNKTKDDLYRMYEDTVIKELCETEMVTKFKHMCVFFGTFKDPDYKERLFNDFESYDNLPTSIKSQLIENYMSLEVSIDDLKK